ncbi:hypothetical protein E3N88_14241 [Mikania micrantha]|uniref:Cytochrome c oxidase subunit 3 n=1 Tax=Mikania micrantha TaxID=192012 RepID=A0A5N6P2K7_9ASTR|nr:hypothetical protein E3N88_14241 [Mikania micrantha]
MPQLDKFTYFTQFFWSCLFLFTFYIAICNDGDGLLGISRILKLRNQLLSHRTNNIRIKDPNSLEDILRKGFSTGLSYMYSRLFEVSQWCKAVDLLGKRRKITLISCFGEISGSRGMERNIFYLISKSSYSTSSNPGWGITCRNDIMLIHKRFFRDQNSGMEGTTRKIYSFSNRPAKTDVQKGSRDSQSLFLVRRKSTGRERDQAEPLVEKRGGLHATEAKLFMIESKRHSYHLVDPSPWPISGSLGALATTVGGVMYMHSFQGGATLLSLGLIFILYTMFVWWRDVLRESTLEGHHTKVVQLGPRYGFILFIVSEVMFLFALFRASSHSSLAPTVEIGGIWPPKGIAVLDPREIPFLNTLIPLSSGAAVTWAHHAILAGKEKRAVYALVATVSLALVFTAFQGMEYYQAPSTISDSIYGSTFFLATGFHGFHVIIGTLFSIICGIRQYLGHLTKEHQVGFEAAAWYWHFVDVVRLFPFVSIYWWGDKADSELSFIPRPNLYPCASYSPGVRSQKYSHPCPLTSIPRASYPFSFNHGGVANQNEKLTLGLGIIRLELMTSTTSRQRFASMERMIRSDRQETPTTLHCQNPCCIFERVFPAMDPTIPYVSALAAFLNKPGRILYEMEEPIVKFYSAQRNMEVLMAERPTQVFHNKVIDGTAMKRLISRFIDHYGIGYTD